MRDQKSHTPQGVAFPWANPPGFTARLPVVVRPQVPGATLVIGYGAARILQSDANTVGVFGRTGRATARRIIVNYIDELIEDVYAAEHEAPVVVELITQLHIDIGRRTDLPGLVRVERRVGRIG